VSTIVQLVFVALLAFYVAWNLGANDVANSIGTSVGSKAITLKKALVIAGILEFTGAVIFGQNVADTLATDVANSSLFADNPQLLVLGMVSVLLSCGIWLQIATSKGLPVASSHAVVGAIAGFSWVAAGFKAVQWRDIGFISLAWLLTPVLSGIVAALFYSLIRRWILEQKNSLEKLQEWIPWLSAILLGVFGVIVLPTIFDRPFFASLPISPRVLSLGVGGIAAVSLTITSWNKLESLSQSKNYKLSQNEQKQALEKIMGRFQLVSACFVAFAHGSNDVGNAIAPLAAIAYILTTNSVPIDTLTIPYWILVLGGMGIVAGLAVQGKNVIGTIGEGIITLQPSIGFCAELATASTILIASRWGLPISTSHAIVGAVVGIGLVRGWKNVRLETVRSVFLAWVITLPATVLIGAISFSVLTNLAKVFG
jgi:PiT family inorganic phosphate transporter